MSGAPLSFARIEKRYGARQVLSIGMLTLPPGRILHLTGRNGAGKTTLLKILAGLEAPDRCDVLRAGARQPWQLVRKHLHRDLVYLHQDPYMFDASVERNLDYGLRVTGVPRALRRRRVDEALARLELDYAAARNARTLSGGERQRLALARAWVLQPRVLLLDEPTANMDSGFRRQTWELLQNLLNDELTIMFSSHELTGAEGLSCQTLHLDAGCLHPVETRLRLVDDAWPASQRRGATP